MEAVEYAAYTYIYIYISPVKNWLVQLWGLASLKSKNVDHAFEQIGHQEGQAELSTVRAKAALHRWNSFFRVASALFLSLSND